MVQSSPLITTFFEKLKAMISSSSLFSRTFLSITSWPSFKSPSSATIGMMPIFLTSDAHPGGTQRASAPPSTPARATSLFQGKTLTQTFFIPSCLILSALFQSSNHGAQSDRSPEQSLTDLCAERHFCQSKLQLLLQRSPL